MFKKYNLIAFLKALENHLVRGAKRSYRMSVQLGKLKGQKRMLTLKLNEFVFS